MAALEPAQALAAMAWVGAGGGAYGRRRGGPVGRLNAWRTERDKAAVDQQLAVAEADWLEAAEAQIHRHPFTRSEEAVRKIIKEAIASRGMIVIGLALLSGSVIIAIKLLLIWILVLAASAASAHLIAQQALRQEQD